jgi:hypothetical protein
MVIKYRIKRGKEMNEDSRVQDRVSLESSQ